MILKVVGFMMLAAVAVPILLAIIIPIVYEISKRLGLAMITAWVIIAFILILI